MTHTENSTKKDVDRNWGSNVDPGERAVIVAVTATLSVFSGVRDFDDVILLSFERRWP